MASLTGIPSGMLATVPFLSSGAMPVKEHCLHTVPGSSEQTADIWSGLLRLTGQRQCHCHRGMCRGAASGTRDPHGCTG